MPAWRRPLTGQTGTSPRIARLKGKAAATKAKDMPAFPIQPFGTQTTREAAATRQLRKQIQNQRKNARLRIEAAATKAKDMPAFPVRI